MATRDGSGASDRGRFGPGKLGNAGTPASGPDSGEATESAIRSYEQTERPGSGLDPGSGDRNTASGASTEDLSR